MSNVEKHINALLGFKVKDRVTGLSGVVVSIGFDLYGCIQAIVNPGLDKDGKPQDTYWFDINRLEVISPDRVMPLPNFSFGLIAEGSKGPSEKPRANKV